MSYLQPNCWTICTPDVGISLLPKWWWGDDTWRICRVGTWMWHHSACEPTIVSSSNGLQDLFPLITQTSFCIGSRRIWTEREASQESRQPWKMGCYHLCYANWVWVEIWTLFAWLESTRWKHQCYCKMWWHAGADTFCREASDKAMQRDRLPFILLFSVWGRCQSNNKFFFLGRGHQISTKQHFLFKRGKSMHVGRGITLHFSAPSRKTHSFIVTAAQQQGFHTACFSEEGKWSQGLGDAAGAECGNGPSLLGPVKFWGTAPSKRGKGWLSDSKMYAEFIKKWSGLGCDT